MIKREAFLLAVLPTIFLNGQDTDSIQQASPDTTLSEHHLDALRPIIMETHKKTLQKKDLDLLTPLQQERELSKTHVIFWHGQNHMQQVAQEFWRALLEALYLKKLPADFIPLRFYEHPDTLAHSDVNKWVSLMTTKDDHALEVRKHLLSVNLALFGNTNTPSESSFSYFIRNDNISKDHRPITTVFDLYDFDQLYSKKIEQCLSETVTPFQDLAKELGPLLAESTNESINALLKDPTKAMTMMIEHIGRYGSLLQICIPKHKVDQCAYLAKPLGKPNLINLNAGGYVPHIKNHVHIRPALSTITSDCLAHDPTTLDSLQARIILTKDIVLNPKSGVKIFRYTQNAEKSAELTHKTHTIAREAIIEWLERMHAGKLPTAALQKIEHTPLYELMQDKQKGVEYIAHLKRELEEYEKLAPPRRQQE